MSISKALLENTATVEPSEYVDIMGSSESDGEYISNTGDSGEDASMKETHPTTEVEQPPQLRNVKRSLFSTSSSSNNAQMLKENNEIKERSNSKSVSASENVITERKRKKKHASSMFEAVVNKPEKQVSITADKGEEALAKKMEKRGLKRTHSSSSTPIADKESLSGTPRDHGLEIREQEDEVVEIQNIDITQPNNNFTKLFTFKDEKKILKELIKTGMKSGTVEFWNTIKDGSLRLSISFDRSRIYEKIRRLKRAYLNSSGVIKDKEKKRLYNLSHQIWGDEVIRSPLEVKKEVQDDEDMKPGEVRQKKTREDADPNYLENLGKFIAKLRENEANDISFPVKEAMNVVPASKMAPIDKMIKGLDIAFLRQYSKHIAVVHELLQAVLSHPSFPSSDEN